MILRTGAAHDLGHEPKIIVTMRSYRGPDLTTIYEPIAPIGQTGMVRTYPKNIQEDLDALIATVIAKWGR